MKTFVATLALLLVLTGCVAPHAIITTSQTVLGASVSENPTTQLYEARFGYARNEFAYVPGDTNSPTAVPNVLMELRVNNIFKGGMIYQRLAVGEKAVGQPGAALMFSKDDAGVVNSNVFQAITSKVENIPTK